MMLFLQNRYFFAKERWIERVDIVVPLLAQLLLLFSSRFCQSADLGTVHARHRVAACQRVPPKTLWAARHLIRLPSFLPQTKKRFSQESDYSTVPPVPVPYCTRSKNRRTRQREATPKSSDRLSVTIMIANIREI